MGSEPLTDSGPWLIRWPWETEWRRIEEWPDDSDKYMPISVARSMGAEVKAVPRVEQKP